jgi:tripartite ATP-independent transporter DctP family solute receptor
LARYLIVIMLIINLGTAGDGRAERLVLGHNAPPETLLDSSAVHFAEAVAKKTRGRLEIELHGRSQLGSEREMLEMARYGKIDLVLSASEIIRSIPAFGVFDMPYLIRDHDHLRRVEEDVVWPMLDPIAQRNGYKLLGVWGYGFRHIANSAHPVRNPYDLKGMRLRTKNSEWVINMFARFGAEPVTMPFGEVYQATQYGVIQGQETTLEAMVAMRFYEIQKHLSLSHHLYTPVFLIMGLDRWSSLGERNQRLLLEAAMAGRDYNYSLTREKDEKALDLMRSRGVKITEVDREAFVEASKGIYDDFASSVKEGADLITRALR